VASQSSEDQGRNSRTYNQEEEASPINSKGSFHHHFWSSPRNRVITERRVVEKCRQSTAHHVDDDVRIVYPFPCGVLYDRCSDEVTERNEWEWSAVEQS
jgi:hypothetical protein